MAYINGVPVVAALNLRRSSSVLSSYFRLQNLSSLASVPYNIDVVVAGQTTRVQMHIPCGHIPVVSTPNAEVLFGRDWIELIQAQLKLSFDEVVQSCSFVAANHEASANPTITAFDIPSPLTPGTSNHFSLTIENTPVQKVFLDRGVPQSVVSPLFFAHNPYLLQPSLGDGAVWLSLEARYHNQAYTTFLPLCIDNTLPLTQDVVLGADFFEKCRANMPALTAAFPDLLDNATTFHPGTSQSVFPAVRTSESDSSSHVPQNININLNLNETRALTPHETLNLSSSPPSSSVDRRLFLASVGFRTFLTDPTSRNYVFTRSLVDLHLILALHGITQPPSSLKESRQALLFHMITGSCMTIVSHNANEYAPPGCTAVSANFSSPDHQQFSVLQYLCSPSFRSVDSYDEHLVDIGTALGLDTKGDVSTHLLDRRRALLDNPAHIEPGLDILSIRMSRLSRSSLVAFAAAHGIHPTLDDNREKIYSLVLAHLNGDCGAQEAVVAPLGCGRLTRELELEAESDSAPSTLTYDHNLRHVALLTYMSKRLSLSGLTRLNNYLGLAFHRNPTKRQLRKQINTHIGTVRKAKGVLLNKMTASPEERVGLIREAWPQILSRTSKDRLIARFDELMSAHTEIFVCGSCSGVKPRVERKTLVIGDDINVSPLLRPDRTPCHEQLPNCEPDGGDLEDAVSVADSLDSFIVMDDDEEDLMELVAENFSGLESDSDTSEVDRNLEAARGRNTSSSEAQKDGDNISEPELKKPIREPQPWLQPGFNIPSSSYDDVPELRDYMFEPKGLMIDNSASRQHKLQCCRPCYSALKKGDTPTCALANRTYLGEVPDELTGLTLVEENMIARCRTRIVTMRMKEERALDDKKRKPGGLDQMGFKGHVIVFPQYPAQVSHMLPPSLDEMSKYICVIFVGERKPSKEWFNKNAAPLAIRPSKVRAALEWLKIHNPLFKHIVINHELLNSLPPESILPVPVQCVNNEDEANRLVDGYDPLRKLPVEDEEADVDGESAEQGKDTMPKRITEKDFEKVVIANVASNATPNDLRTAALNHIKYRRGGYLEIRHEKGFVREFKNPSLYPMMYPTLFPYGLGGLDDPDRQSRLTVRSHVKHLCSIRDSRFREHASFLFSSFNMLQRHEMLMNTAMKMKNHIYRGMARNFTEVSASAVAAVSSRIAKGDTITWRNASEKKVLDLMRHARIITGRVQGSAEAKKHRRNQIKALTIDKGPPSYYITINPADLYHPLVRLSSGREQDIDDLCEKDMIVEGGTWNQYKQLIADPFMGAKFFNRFMEAVIKGLLGYDPSKSEPSEGVLGVVKGYYGCVEAQARGSLHCHMLIWVEGSLNPNELRAKLDQDTPFRARLIEYLDDLISNAIPESVSQKPVSVRSDRQGKKRYAARVKRQDREEHQDDASFRAYRRADLRNLVRDCQVHGHTGSCYKHCKKGEPKVCRYELEESNTTTVSTYNPETGELTLRHLDGLVNNYNPTMLEAMRCNMDIKFISSGASAKAMMYYITDYITKSQLKTQVAYDTVELTIKQLSEANYNEKVGDARAQKVLNSCAYRLTSHQELSGQEVAMYLLGHEDYYTSHNFRPFFWGSFEGLIDKQLPSPECYVASHKSTNLTETEDNQQNQEPDNNPDDASESEAENSDTETEDPIDQPEEVAYDYRHRSPKLDSVCVWDFVAQVDRVSKSSRYQPEIAPHEDESEPEDFDDGSYNPGSMGNSLLDNTDRKRPRLTFSRSHLNCSSQLQVVRKPTDRYVPVPIGTLPRRDRQETVEKHARLMLILFKPWRQVQDLRGSFNSWSAAYHDFLENNCSQQFVKYIDNMQILHESRDSRDDHFDKRRAAWRIRPTIASSRNGEGVRDIDDSFGSDSTPEQILDHLKAVEDEHRRSKAKSREDGEMCLEYAKESGLFEGPQLTEGHMDVDLVDEATDITMNPDGLESVWDGLYTHKRQDWLSSFSGPDRPHEVTSTHPTSDPTQNQIVINNGDSFRDASNSHDEDRNGSTFADQIVIPESRTWQDCSEPIEAIVKEFNLNKEQARAFKLVAEHSLHSTTQQLRMLIAGPGGSGKSTIIRALTEFFRRRAQERRLRLSSFTGVAACNIGGMTLHSALNLRQWRRTGAVTSFRAKQQLQAMWEGVDYLFIDEVSMIGTELMNDVSEALCVATGKSAPFGGINVIFAGDFAQLTPVGANKLFADLGPQPERKGIPRWEREMFGKLLWLSVDTVVNLTEICRSRDPRLTDLLGRARNGKCNELDIAVLESRLASNVLPDWKSKEWRTAPIIVSNNQAKDMLNEHAAVAYAHANNAAIHWYHSLYYRAGTLESDPQVIGSLDALSSDSDGAHTQLYGKIPLVVGMPVMITKNFDIPGGVVNGSIGTLKDIRYTTDAQGNRHAHSAVIHVPGSKSVEFPGCDKEDVVVLEQTVNMSLVHKFQGRRCTFTRKQLPIVPAFAITCHKAQGRTLENVVVDLQSCKGTEPAYVMLSRATTLNGLIILRPFDPRKVQCRPSQERRNELRRQQALGLQTIYVTGTKEEQKVAKRALSILSANTDTLASLTVAGNDQIVSSNKPAVSAAEECVRSTERIVRRLGRHKPEIAGKGGRKRKADTVAQTIVRMFGYPLKIAL